MSAELTMSRIFSLPGGKAIAVSGRTGSGKSSLFFYSRHVTRIFLADSGSGGHHFNKLPGTVIVEVDLTNPRQNPVQQVMGYVRQWTDEGLLWMLDSFTTLQEQAVAWLKIHQANKRSGRLQGRVLLEDHQKIVGDLRDLALFLATRPGFVLFNTSPGGQVRDPDGKFIDLPKGVLVGYPALSGLRENAESVLARFTSSWILFPGYIEQDKESGRIKRQIPRGFLLPGRDLRGGNVGNFAPIKDPMQVLEDSELEAPPVEEPPPAPASGPAQAPEVVRTPAAPVKPRRAGVHVIPKPTRGQAYIDTMIDRLAALYPEMATAPQRLQPAPPAVTTPPKTASTTPPAAETSRQQRGASGGR